MRVRGGDVVSNSKIDLVAGLGLTGVVSSPNSGEIRYQLYFQCGGIFEAAWARFMIGPVVALV